MSNACEYDVAVIGSGPGGYVAAIRAALGGKKVALIEKDALGGTCLNVGCIPTKTLIASAQILQKITKAKDFGILINAWSVDYFKMKTRKDDVVKKIRSSLEGLIKSHGVDIKWGHAKFTGANELKITGKDSCFIKADHIIIASGSTTLDIPAFPCDHEYILNSTSILEMASLPSSLIIIGGGYIGCEFASLYAELGVKITIVEALGSILQTQGPTISNFLTKKFTEKGIKLLTQAKVQKIDKGAHGVKVHLADGTILEADKVLVSIGRKIVSQGMDIEKAGILVNEKGLITVNDKMQTNIDHIYAIGDVTGIAMLAHVASHQGIVAASHILNLRAHMHYNAVPAVIFTLPEVAIVGITLEEAEKKGIKAKLGSFPFQALGKSQAIMETDGMVQIVVDSTTHAILGAQVIGYDASSLISEMALAIQNELTLECLAETIHAHPTLPEAWLEASLITLGTPIHFPPKNKKK